MTDANLAHVAPKLREKGIDCETVHKLMRNNEYSQESIVDGEIVSFLRQAKGGLTLITSDIDLSDHCKFSAVPYLTIWDAVAEHVMGKRQDHEKPPPAFEGSETGSSRDISTRVAALWDDTNRILGDKIDDYSDDNWLEDYSPDKYLAFVLSWGPLKEPARKAVWDRIEKSLDDRPLTDFSSGNEIRYPLPWQNRFFERLTHFLASQNMSAAEFVDSLRNSGYSRAKETLLRIVESDSEKIVDCWIRDVVRLNAFPIDSNVRRVLREYAIPPDSDLITECAESLKIPVRKFARAVYGEADSILAKHKAKKRISANEILDPDMTR